MPEPIINALLPASGAKPGKVVTTLMSLRQANLPILYGRREGEEAPVGPDVKAVDWEGKTIGSLIEAARRNHGADLYLWLPPGARTLPGIKQEFVDALLFKPLASLYVSDYYLGDKRIHLTPHRDDLTEREDWGVIWGLPGWALRKIGGANPDLKYTTFYDLRLKLAEIGPVAHIQEPTCRIDPPDEDKAGKADTLFFPGRGAFGGFSYLFMQPEEEKETEQVFYNSLKRRGAFLEPRDNEVSPAAVGPDDPIVTVVIPVFNRARFIPKALDSVLRGTLQNFEIIVVDNASTDDTVDVVEEYTRKDSRIILLKNDVNVIAKALNVGVKAARGRYIAQLDSDDEYVPNTLQDMVDHLESHPKAGLAISYYELMNEDGEVLEEFGVIKHLEYNLNNILRVDGAGALRCWRKSVIEEFGGFQETDFPNYGEDYDLVLKVSERYDVDRVHKVCYRYRRHPDNTDALRQPADKIRAKTLARTNAVMRRRALNGFEGSWHD